MRERVAGLVVGLAFVITGMLFIVLGLTFLPVIGVLIGLPVMRMSMSFLRPDVSAVHANEEVYRLACLPKAA